MKAQFNRTIDYSTTAKKTLEKSAVELNRNHKELFCLPCNNIPYIA